ncbi:MAG: hypothetical protein RLZZ84_1177 [Pseudomonadota bacterium]|jgi:iron complex outermembrane receptor protein
MIRPVTSTAATRISASFAALAVALVAAPAFAADAAGDDASSIDNSGLTEIVVTATKRETNLQQTPIAIAVVSADDIKKRHVQSLIDLADGGVPSLRVATFEARQSALTIGMRGIVPFDANQTARDQGVGVYVDGIYLGRQQGLNAALFDVQRIEVLRGPQGTLFGRNTEGGAVSIVTKEPTGEFGGRVSAGVGNFGSYSTEAHVDFPAIANVAFKIDGLVQHQDPTVKNPLAGQAGWNQYQRAGGRISAKWTPIEGFSAVLSYDKAKDENTPFYSQLINYNPTNLPVATLAQIAAAGNKVPAGMIAPLSPLVTVAADYRMTTADIGVVQAPSVDRTEGFTSTLKYEIAPKLELRSITAWRNVSTEQWDNSGGAHRTVFLPNSNFSRYSLSNLHQRQFSQEFQVVGSTDHLDYALGLYYFNERAQEEAATPSTNKWNADGTGYTINSELVTGTVTSGNQGWDPSVWFKQRGSYAYAKSYAAFGQATWTPIDVLHITAGGRYTHDKRNGVLYKVLGVNSNFAFNYDAKRFDPMVTVAVDASQDINLYAKYATGYRAGGANSRSQTFTAFAAESVKSYEVGAKMDLLDRHVRFNVAGYIMNRNGTQTDFDNVDTTPSSPTFNLHTEETRNAPGTSKIKGLEVDLRVRPMEGLTLGASYAYTDVNVPATSNPFLGNALYQVYTVFTPKNAVSGDMEYETTVAANGAALRFHIDANYADPQYSFQNEAVQTESSFIVNGRVALVDVPMGEGGAKASFAVWARNLLNETHIYRRSDANAKTLGSYANFNPPRTFGVEATISF